MQISRKLSKRYAIGLFQVAEEFNVVDELLKEAKLFIHLMHDCKDLQNFFRSHILDKKRKISIIEILFKANSKPCD